MRKKVFPAMVLACFSMVFCFPGLCLAGPAPDTGQNACSNTTAPIDCPSPGEAFFGQDAQFQTPRSFTKLGPLGNALPDNSPTWAMVQDNLTGLVWEVKDSQDGQADYNNPHDADNTYSWYSSNPAVNLGNEGTAGDNTDTEDFINALNAGSFGGFSDWRFPTIMELSSIVNRNQTGPTTYVDFFPNTISNYYWTSATKPSATNCAWRIHFDHGRLDWYTSKAAKHYMRAVRGGIPGSAGTNFVDNGDQTVTDTKNGLMWKQTQDGKLHWESALALCENQVFPADGYTDWRLPNINELHTLADYKRLDTPTTAKSFFPDTRTQFYWTSSSAAASPPVVTCINFSDGSFQNQGKTGTYYFRMVRGAQGQHLGSLPVTTPQPGSVWKWNQPMNIAWDDDGLGGDVEIAVSSQGGKPGSFSVIEAATPNDGSYGWVVSGPASVNYVIRITPAADPAKAASQGMFTVLAKPGDVNGDEEVGLADAIKALKMITGNNQPQ